MWWQTTAVYRVNLPYNEIKNLNKIPIKMTTTVGIFTHDIQRSELLINELKKIFENNEVINVDFKQIIIKQNNNVDNAKTPAQLEKIIFSEFTISPGDFVFIEWNKLKEKILITSDRTGYITNDTPSTIIASVLRNWIYQEHKLISMLKNPTLKENTITRHKSGPLESNYNILISILNPRPDLQKVNWNVRLASKKYLKPFLNEISSLSNFTLLSQWQYQVAFDFPNKQVPDKSSLGRHYVLQEEHLPHIITSVEKNLGNAISNTSAVHLVVYVPPCKIAPLYIYNKNGKDGEANKTNVNSFLSAKWGGVIIANPSESSCLKYMETEEQIEVDINSEEIMQIMLYLLRKLFDMHNEITINDCNMVQIDKLIPRSWEVDMFLRNNVIHMLNTATVTLNSLIQLLNDINYIVINDKVANSVLISHENIIKGKIALLNNDLENAVTYAKLAHQSSEIAFFDPSLLSLLYFPDEQKYAIYVPLFLPVMLPVVKSFSMIKVFLYKIKNKVD